MKTSNRLLTVAFALCIGCSTASLALDEGVKATVNGNPIMQSMVDSVAQQLQANNQAADEARIVEELVNLQLLSELAEKEGLHKSEEIANVLQLQRNRILANSYMAELSKDISVSDEEIQAEYDIQTAQMQSQEYNASHILLENEEDAKAVIEELEGGADFAALAKEKSTGPSGPNGGELGWFNAETMVPEFADAVRAMEAGATSASPVKTEFGWHVIKLNESRGTQVPALENVKPQIENVLMRTKLAEKITALRDKAEIELAE